MRATGKGMCCGAKSLYQVSTSNSVVCYKQGSSRVGVRKFHVRLDRVRRITGGFFGNRYHMIIVPGCSGNGRYRLRLIMRGGRLSGRRVRRCLCDELPCCVVPGRVRYLRRFPLGADDGASEGGVRRLVWA